MPSLLELPTEIFEEVIIALSKVTNLPDMFRARAFCRTFASFVNHRLIAETPLEAFKPYRSHVRAILCRDRGPYMFLDANLEDLLFHHTKASMDFEDASHLNGIFDKLGFSSEKDKTETNRDQYLRDLCRAYICSSIDLSASEGLTTTAEPKPKWRTLDILEYLGAVDQQVKQQVISTLLAVAAAVGNSEAVAHYLAQGSQILAKLDYFGTPLIAAACTGQSKILCTFLKETHQDVLAVSASCTHTRSCMAGCKDHLLFWSFTAAIRAAVDFNQPEAALTLFTFTQKNFPKWLLDEQSPYFVHAMRTASLDMVKLLIQAEGFGSKVSTNCTNSTVNEAFKNQRFREAQKMLDNNAVPKNAQGKDHMLMGAHAACIAGRTRVIQHLLDQGHITWNTIYHKRDREATNTVALVTQYDHRALVDLYINQGNLITSRDLLNALTRPLSNDQISPPVFLMVHHLIRAGTVVDEQTLQTCESRTGRIQVRIYKQDMYCCITDGAMTATLLAHEAMKHLPQLYFQSYGSIKLFLRNIINGKLKVPTEPMPFREMATEVMAWLKGPTI